MSGPTTPARAWPEVTPKVPMATAMASSKLLPAAVNASVVVARVAEADGAAERACEPAHMSAK